MEKQGEHENPQQVFVELSDEQLEQVSGGKDSGMRYAARALTDIPTLGLAEIFWQSKTGKKTWKRMKEDDKYAGDHGWAN